MKPYFQHIIFFFAFSFCFSGFSKGAADDPSFFWRAMYQDALVNLIGDREMLFSDQRAGHNTVMALTVVHAPPEDVWPLIGDFKKYPKLIHEFIEVKPEKGETAHLRLQGLKAGPVSMAIDYYAKPETLPHSRFTLKYLKGKTKAQISWELIPLQDGKSTVLVFILSGTLAQAAALAVAGSAARQIKTAAETEK